MKELRARGIEKLTRQLRDDCVHLMRLSRGDEVLQEAFRSTLGPLGGAESRAAEIHDGGPREQGIYWNDEGCWSTGPQGTIGPFETEEEALHA